MLHNKKQLKYKNPKPTCVYQFSSVAQSCPTFCDPMNRSTPGLPVHHHFPEFTQTHVHRVRDAIQPSHPRSSLSPTALNPSQHQSPFQWVNSLREVAKVLEFQLQHHSLQRNSRVDLLQNGLYLPLIKMRIPLRTFISLYWYLIKQLFYHSVSFLITLFLGRTVNAELLGTSNLITRVVHSHWISISLLYLP